MMFKTAFFFLALAIDHVGATLRGSENTVEEQQQHRELATLLGDWAFCSTSSQCQNGCCSKQYSNDGKLKCTPLNGGFNANICVSTSTSTLLNDWDLCTTSSQCKNGCCSKQYSNDGKLKCTPLNGGFNANICVSGGTSSGGGITSKAKTLTVSDLQAGLNKYAELQGGSITATQANVDKLNTATSGLSLYRQIAFVAHAIWESGGLKYTEEIAATTPPYTTRSNYQTCDWGTGATATNGKFFYGRGYMQLSWCANYMAYGKARMINGDPNYFYNNPEQVATNYAWDSASWYFSANVNDTSGKFGLTTKAINGPIECTSGNNYVGSAPQKRYQIFQALATAVGLTGYTEGGCYN